ncbi:hypothetical protein [Ktedonospora formicarum]|uniref:Uncharacterized protein n=1 Tax=Ktedonospora formicarum TaxID=2778364 RepID=A0A8J3I7W9_9CHLR|nr:hypothetical protein [Ktedonospora formicarum]GHO51164.1 hypothetical protein KSX_93270 [Ktedonospora formicarum]
MGYDRTFRGFFGLDKALQPEQSAYLRRFTEMRHVPRNEELLRGIPDPLRALVGLPLGEGGMYFTGMIDEDLDAQLRTAEDSERWRAEEEGLWRMEAINFPSSRCQWVPKFHGTAIGWDGEEKFYGAVGWLRFLIEHFLRPWGYYLSGSVQYEGEQGEHGRIVVEQDEVVAVEERDSLLPREPSEGTEPDPHIYWMTVGAVSEQARQALVEADGQVIDVHASPPVVLVGLPYDVNYYFRHRYDDLAIWRTEGIQVRSKGLRFEYGDLWNEPDERGLDPSWRGCVRDTLMLPEEYHMPVVKGLPTDDETFPPF